MPYFRKKPVVIEAMKFNGDVTAELVSWLGSVFAIPEGISIPTLEGSMLASPGDWIIKGVKGEFYPCKPDIFDLTYEPVEDNT